MTADARIYVNEASVARSRRGEAKPGSLTHKTFRSQPNDLVCWSTTEHPSTAVDQYLDRPVGFQNSSPLSGFNQKEIDEAIDKPALRHHVKANQVRALVRVESNFNPDAVLRKGAMEPMQLMPRTARRMKLRNPFNPQTNMDAGVRHLRELLDTYSPDVRLTRRRITREWERWREARGFRNLRRREII